MKPLLSSIDRTVVWKGTPTKQHSLRVSVISIVYVFVDVGHKIAT